MPARPYQEIDVFTDRPFLGNPLAVVLEANGLQTEQMQQFARWTNLSETAFLLPAIDERADYRVRIFTPSRELPFAGHPTIGSCRAWLAHGGRPRQPGFIVQECGLGLVRLRREGDRIAFCAPPLTRMPVEADVLARCLAALGITGGQVRHAQVLENGPRWHALVLDSAQAVLELEPDHDALKDLGLVGVIGPTAPEAPVGPALGWQFVVRAFCASDNIPEDPVTGSLNAALAQWLIAQGLAPDRYVASQGARLGRDGRVHVRADAGEVWVGGDCVICVAGTVQL